MSAQPFRSPWGVPPKVIGSTLDQPPQQRKCNCKNSNCLKLYCECMGVGAYCGDSCKCRDCQNTFLHENTRRGAVETILERNPHAFRPRLAVVGKACHCKKSLCLKKYCECFQANVWCDVKCKCTDCRNTEGDPERAKVALPPKEAAIDTQESSAADVATSAAAAEAASSLSSALTSTVVSAAMAAATVVATASALDKAGQLGFAQMVGGTGFFAARRHRPGEATGCSSAASSGDGSAAGAGVAGNGRPGGVEAVTLRGAFLCACARAVQEGRVVPGRLARFVLTRLRFYLGPSPVLHSRALRPKVTRRRGSLRRCKRGGVSSCRSFQPPRPRSHPRCRLR